jgi:cell division septal protein FtsQ
MWFRDERRSGGNRYGYRRLSNTRQAILMVSARSSEQRRWQRQKIGAILVVLVALAGTVWAFKVGADHVAARLWLRNERFVLENLVVRSDGRLRAEHVRQYGGIKEGMGLFEIRLADLRDALASIPLVESVSLERRLPDTLIIDIREREPVARLQTASARFPFSIDRTGMVLAPALSDTTLPLISGFSGQGLRPGVQINDPAIRAALDLVQLCEMPQYSRILRVVQLDVSSPYCMDVQFSQGERVMMPYQKYDTKLKYACEIIKRAADMGQAVAALDMTVERNFPVKYR